MGKLLKNLYEHKNPNKFQHFPLESKSKALFIQTEWYFVSIGSIKLFTINGSFPSGYSSSPCTNRENTLYKPYFLHISIPARKQVCVMTKAIVEREHNSWLKGGKGSSIFVESAGNDIFIF